MSNRKSSHWLADSCLLATTVMWGVNLLVVKWILREIDPLSFNAVRMTLSTVALGLSVAVESRLASRERQPLDWKRFFAFALLSGLAYPLMFMLGVEETTAGNTALLLSSMPMWTAIISFLFLSERLSRLAWLGLVVTSLGTAVIALEKGSVDISIDHLKGNLLMLAAAITWATATVVSGPLLRQSSPLKVAFWANLTTTPIHLLITMNKIPTTLSALLEWPQIAGLFYSGILSTGLAYVTWHYGVRQLGASHAAAYQNVVTLVGVLGGWMFLSEHIALTQMLGGFAIVYGLLLARRGRPNKSSSFSSDSQEAIEVRPSKLSRE